MVVVVAVGGASTTAVSVACILIQLSFNSHSGLFIQVSFTVALASHGVESHDKSGGIGWGGGVSPPQRSWSITPPVGELVVVVAVLAQP